MRGHGISSLTREPHDRRHHGESICHRQQRIAIGRGFGGQVSAAHGVIRGEHHATASGAIRAAIFGFERERVIRFGNDRAARRAPRHRRVNPRACRRTGVIDGAPWIQELGEIDMSVRHECTRSECFARSSSLTTASVRNGPTTTAPQMAEPKAQVWAEREIMMGRARTSA